MNLYKSLGSFMAVFILVLLFIDLFFMQFAGVSYHSYRVLFRDVGKGKRTKGDWQEHNK